MTTDTNTEKSENKEDVLKNMFEDVIKTDPNQVLVLSVDQNGVLNFNTNAPTYPMIHYILNRALFEIVLHERANQRVSEDEAKAA